MAERLSGKVAVVTAAGQGIGRAIAAAFLREGARVFATDLDPGKLDGLAGAETRKLDVISTEAVEALARETGPIDILVNAAGFVHHGTVLDCSDRDWDFSFDLNVKSMHRTIKAFLPGMLERGGGSIVNIASGASSVRGIPNRYAYGASKAAVIGLTKSLGKELADTGIRVNCITPAAVKTPIFDQMTPQHIAFMLSKIPMARFGTVAEVAAMVSWLCTEDCSFTTGAVFDLSGGRSTY
jgi:2-keto-3-deoxy-L-fuconate dehydrogenase